MTAVAVATLGAPLLVSATAQPAAAAPPPTSWEPPVDGPIVSEYEAPDGPFAPGHRGVDYAVAPASPVRAASGGRVRFAGKIGAASYVSIDHGDGIVTTYSFLADSSVSRDALVGRGDVVGTSPPPTGTHGGLVHFGVLVDGEYVDPRGLFAPVELTEVVRLVPTARDAGRAATDPHDELVDVNFELHRHALPAVMRADDWLDAQHARRRSGLRKAWDATTSFLATHGHDALEWLAEIEGHGFDGTRSIAQRLGLPAATGLRPLSLLLDVTDAVSLWLGRSCEASPPARGPDEVVVANYAVFVAGIASEGTVDEHGALVTNDIPLDEIFPADAIVAYSYAGADVPYTADDTYGPVEAAARGLRDQLVALEAAQGPLEVDLVAHSMGGLVVETFMRLYYEESRDVLPDVVGVHTIASPHEGAPGAGAIREIADGLFGGIAGALHPLVGTAAVADLDPDSELFARLAEHPWPPDVPVTRFASVTDPIVPATSNDRPDGAEHVPVWVSSPSSHGASTTSERVLDRLATSVTGDVPCATFWEHVGGAVVGNVASQAERELGHVLAPG